MRHITDYPAPWRPEVAEALLARLNIIEPPGATLPDFTIHTLAENAVLQAIAETYATEDVFTHHWVVN